MNNGSELFYKGKEVALFYLRAGYDPSCYITDPKSNEMDPQSWSNRLLIEKSRSIKSPPVNYHLLTNKRFQGMLLNIKWGASSQWSFGPNSAWGSIETTIIGKHPTLFLRLDSSTRKPMKP